jgi:hypothetical protein
MEDGWAGGGDLRSSIFNLRGKSSGAQESEKDAHPVPVPRCVAWIWHEVFPARVEDKRWKMEDRG